MHALILGLPGGAEWVILAIVALLIFGGARLAGVGQNAGRASREFKEETRAIKANEPIPADEKLPDEPSGPSSSTTPSK